jgi:hypothetical protein
VASSYPTGIGLDLGFASVDPHITGNVEP